MCICMYLKHLVTDAHVFVCVFVYIYIHIHTYISVCVAFHCLEFWTRTVGPRVLGGSCLRIPRATTAICIEYEHHDLPFGEGTSENYRDLYRGHISSIPSGSKASDQEYLHQSITQ